MDQKNNIREWNKCQTMESTEANHKRSSEGGVKVGRSGEHRRQRSDEGEPGISMVGGEDGQGEDLSTEATLARLSSISAQSMVIYHGYSKQDPRCQR